MSLTIEDKQFISEAIRTNVQPIADAAVDKLARSVHAGFSAVGADIAEVKTDIKQIKFELAGTVHRSEHNDLKFRVERLEEKER